MTLSIRPLQQAVGFLVLDESCLLGIEAERSAQARGDIPQMAQRRREMGNLHVGVGFAVVADRVCLHKTLVAMAKKSYSRETEPTGRKRLGSEQEPLSRRFDITRMHQFGNRVMHLGFGKGEHMCLGRKLAEMQLDIYLEELLKTYPAAASTMEPRRVESNFVTGFKDLPVKLR